MNEQTLTTIFEIPARRSGCYILRNKGQVVYVGMSGDVLSRLAGHREKTFESVEIIWCKHKEAAKLERCLIKQHAPPLNKSLIPGRVCPVKFWTNYAGPIKQANGIHGWIDAKLSGSKLAKYRNDCGVSIKALSEASGIQLGTIYRAESGKRTRYGTWDRICKGFFEISKALTRRGQTRTKTLGI